VAVAIPRSIAFLLIAGTRRLVVVLGGDVRASQPHQMARKYWNQMSDTRPFNHESGSEFSERTRQVTYPPQDRECSSLEVQSQRGVVPKIGLQMIRQSLHGMLFFRGEVRTCVGYYVSQTCARLHSDGLGLLPIEFYVTFDDFLTVGKCRLAWRWHDDVAVTFDGWVDAQQRISLLRQLH
jgi:hypothetical protein